MRWVQASDEQLYQGVYLKNQEEAVMLRFIILGFPLLSRQTAPFILFSTVGIIIETIITMAFYTRIIEKKYRKRK